MSVIDINLRYGARPVAIDPGHRVVLIPINRAFERDMSYEALYEATRKWWRVGPGQRQLGGKKAPEWAMSVFGGVVRAIYRVESWEQATAEDIAGGVKRVGRWAFRGMRDREMERIYLHRDVSRYLRGSETGHASQNPIRYVNRDGGH